MRNAINATLPVAIAFGLAVLTAQTPATPQPASVAELAVNARDHLPEVRAWDDRINTLLRTNGLALRTVRADTLLDGRTHERYDQYVAGVRVFGGAAVRQVNSGIVESIFGTLYDRIDVATIPTLSEADARDLFEALGSAELPTDRAVELVILPRDEGGYALTWRAHLWSDRGWMNTFLDAHTGAVLLEYNDLQTQSAVGTGTGVLGDRKKVSARSVSGQYWADDQLRPPLLITYDLRGNVSRAVSIMFLGSSPLPSEVASDGDNIWTDTANVDAHVYLGWTYDYLFKRFGRKGLDDRDVPLRAITHPARRADVFFAPDEVIDLFYLNAFWCGECAGGQGVMSFGEGLPTGLRFQGKLWNYFAGALDIVAHELSHGLTEHSSRLIYRNESGALNEAFSDMLGTSVEFFYQAPGTGLRQADYLIAEDILTPGGARSMSNPQAFGDPDHYSRRSIGSTDNGFVHRNSAIPNHAFYLAIEGGVNRTSGRSVQGVGAANREQIEKVFYRAFVSMLPSNATFRLARAATIQSARDLYGAGSPAERAVTEAWTAVGVN